MRASQASGAHVCRSCGLPFVQPEGGKRDGRGWIVRLRCANCGWRAETVLDQDQMDRLDEQLDEGLGRLAAALASLTWINMQEYVDRFTTALTADAILPEDF